MNVELTINK